MAVGYYDYGEFLRKHFAGKVQKIAIDAGFMCPNRDGTKGYGGCIYCNNQSFNPAYCQTRISVAEQITKGKEFFARKYPQMQYLAYFQAYTNTYANIARLKQLYEEALSQDGVVGLIIATRPDCMPDDLLQYLSQLAMHTFVMVEYGVETSHDHTLQLINRGHSWADVWCPSDFGASGRNCRRLYRDSPTHLAVAPFDCEVASAASDTRHASCPDVC